MFENLLSGHPGIGRSKPNGVHLKNWREISNDPNAPEVRAYLQAILLRGLGRRVEDPELFTADFVRGRTVLDVGCIGHVVERSETEYWRFGAIAKIARHALGIDILPEAIDKVRARGYNVLVADATGDADLGERFERVVIGDVIEHVDDPVRLIRFAARHLAPGGLILCTTPNPFYVGYLVEMFRHGMIIENAEHVTFIIPSNAIEIANRAGVELVGLHYQGGGGNTAMRRFLISLLKHTGLIGYEMFSRSYVYIFRGQSDAAE